MISDRLKEQTKGRWRSILTMMGLPESLLNGQHQPCPFCGGKDRFRFTDHEGMGFWWCNQCGNGTGFDLASKFLDKGFPQVCSDIEKILGSGLPMVKWDNTMRTSEKNAVNRIWKDSIELNIEDPVCRYLHGRGLSSATRVLRHHKAVWDGSTGDKFHSMIAPITDCLGEMTGIHITHLARAGMAHENQWVKSTQVKSARKMRKLNVTISGGSIRLFKMDPNHLGLAEGIETALAVKELYGVNCWSVLNATLMEKFHLPVPKPLKITIYADRDANFTGLKSAFILANRLVVRDDFPNVFVERPMVIGDFLDELNGHALRKKVDQKLV